MTLPGNMTEDEYNEYVTLVHDYSIFFLSIPVFFFFFSPVAIHNCPVTNEDYCQTTTGLFITRVSFLFIIFLYSTPIV